MSKKNKLTNQVAVSRSPAMICSADAAGKDAERFTPETRAIQIVREWQEHEPISNANLMVAISTAIREAVELERENCAKVAENYNQTLSWGEKIITTFDVAAAEIAETIRHR